MIRWVACRLSVFSVASYIRSSKYLRYDAAQQFGLSTGFVNVFLIPDVVPLPIPILHVFSRRGDFSVWLVVVLISVSAAPLVD